MAITLNKYTAELYATAAAKAAEFLTASGMFDSVVYDDTAHIVTCKTDGNDILVLGFVANNTARFDVTLNGTSIDLRVYQLSQYHIGKSAKGVIIGAACKWSIDESQNIISVAVTKSYGNVPMIVLQEHKTYSPGLALTTDYDGAAIALTLPTRISSSEFSAVCGVSTTATGSEGIATADGIGYLVTAQTNVPTTAACKVSIGGYECITDGYIVLID